MGTTATPLPADATGATAPPPADPSIPGLPQPKLTLQQAFGEDYPNPDANDADKVRFLDGLAGRTQSDAMARYRQAVLCALYWGGKHHVTWNSRKLEYEELALEEGEVRVTYNLIRPIVRSCIQRILSPRVTFSCLAKSNGMEERDRARAASNWLNARWRAAKMDHTMLSAMQLAMTGGICALKGYWNSATGPIRTASFLFPRIDPTTGQPMIGEDMQPVMDEHPVNAAGAPVHDPRDAHHYRPGDTGTALRSVFNIRVNPEAHGWTAEEGLQWVLDEEMIPVATARRLWPECANKIAEGPNLPALTYERMAAASETRRPAPVQGLPVSQTTAQRAPSTLHREYWQVPDDDYFPYGRLIVQMGSAIVYDDAFPQNVWPYTPIYDEPGLLSGMGRPRIVDMISLQDAINREFTAIVQEMIDSGQGQFVSWDIPEVPDQMTREPRAIIKVPVRTFVANRGIKDVFTRLEPAHVAPDRWRIIETSERALQNIGAYHEVTRGTTPPGVDSGVAIKQLIEQEEGQLAMVYRALENSVLQWARVQLAIAKWGYGDDEERFIPVDRPDLGFQVETVKGVDLPDPETIELSLENFRPTSQAEQEAEIKWAFANKLIDGRSALRALDMGRGMNAIFESETRHYARARSENLKIQRGEFIAKQSPETGLTELFNTDDTPFFLLEHDDHAIHVLVLQELILDDTQPPDVRQLAEAHASQHIAAIRALQVQQVQQQGTDQPPPGGGDAGPGTPEPAAHAA